MKQGSGEVLVHAIRKAWHGMAAVHVLSLKTCEICASHLLRGASFFVRSLIIPMNRKQVRDYNRGVNCTANDRESRVKVYTLGGEQIGIPVVGEGARNTQPSVHQLTFPRMYAVGDALACDRWIRFASPEEEREDEAAGRTKRWWRPFTAFRPRSLIYDNGTHASDHQMIGMSGLVVTAVQESYQDSWTTKPCCDVSGIKTLPSPLSSDGWRSPR